MGLPPPLVILRRLGSGVPVVDTFKQRGEGALFQKGSAEHDAEKKHERKQRSEKKRKKTEGQAIRAWGQACKSAIRIS